MKALFEPLKEYAEYDRLVDLAHGGTYTNKQGVVSLRGCVDSQKMHLAYAISSDVKYRLMITYDELRAQELWQECLFYDERAVLYPAKDLIFFQADIHGNELTRRRVVALRRILEDDTVTVVTTMSALMSPQVLMNAEEGLLHISNTDELQLKKLSRDLVRLGYDKVAQVDSPGQFSIRGDIVDVFDLTEENPFRIELWGDEVDSIRSFDVLTQRSIENLDSITIYPATEFVLSGQQVQDGVGRIMKEAAEQEARLRKLFLTEEAYRVKTTAKQLQEQILEFAVRANLESYIHYFYPKGEETGVVDSLVGHLQRLGDVAVFVEEPSRVKEQAEAVSLEFRESFSHRLEKGYILPGQQNLLYSGEQVAASLAKSPVFLLSTLENGAGYFNPAYRFDIDARNVPPYHGSLEALVKDLENYRKKKYKVLLVSGSRKRAERLAENLRDYEACAVYSDNPERTIIPGEALTVYGNISKGFEYPLLKFVVLTEGDIFDNQEKKKKKRRKSAYSGQAISSLEDLKPGDYVIHETFGLGIYRGIEKVTTEGTAKDYMRIDYRDGGVLYVLATDLNAVQKYASADAEKVPKINKLGTKEWERTKTKVRTNVEGVAKELVELYAKRQKAEGFRFGEDTVWQREFEEKFPYEETDDQLMAIRDTKEDMESAKAMDRLICGDVGFGKTEIAIRAAFKAVQEGKQVAYLVPTTILAQQHYNTFVQRMKDYPVRIELLSRFRTTKEVKTALEDLRKGLVDIIIGTHRILSGDVVYKDLGLLIIDEEQRFGVGHKEKIKQLKENVDVLTLSATPIPRTLHMSLVGIRDMSLLEEAPNDRLPIQTFVCEYNEEMVREAIVRELARGGQVYYVNNRIRNIADVTAHLQELVPNAEIAYAHGQMGERELEDIMYDFVNGEIDVLVSTTIIETGMDISNVNTLIIQDSDRMGLSQLYQLRGRVGRSNRMAYAFLMYQKDRILSEVAEKRLAAIREFTDLGSGYRIAMRDLEIRGAGNLLGKSQHGHMEAVGYDLYCKMLNEEVSKLKGIPLQEEFVTTITMKVDAFIPQEYIFNEEQKLDMYKRIASAQTGPELDEISDELIDRFGDIPRSADNLLRIARIRVTAHSFDLTEVKGRDGRIVLIFKPDAKVDPLGIPVILQKYGKAITFTSFGNPNFTLRYEPELIIEQEEKKILSLTEDLLRDMEVMRMKEEASDGAKDETKEGVKGEDGE